MTEVQQWQKAMIDRVFGARPGELTAVSTGRRAGKSMVTQQAIDRLTRDLNSRPVEELVLAQRSYMDTQYYTVAPIGGNWLAMETWCVDTFGEAAEVWDLKSADEQFIWPEAGRWYKNDRKFWFRNERDRTMFIMRWSR